MHQDIYYVAVYKIAYKFHFFFSEILLFRFIDFRSLPLLFIFNSVFVITEEYFNTLRAVVLSA